MGECDERPWEQPGAVRRDCEPHRDKLLLVPAFTSQVLFAVSLPMLLGGTYGWVMLGRSPGLPLPVRWSAFFDQMACIPCAFGLVIGIVTYAEARRDLMKMSTGQMDRAGRHGIIAGLVVS